MEKCSCFCDLGHANTSTLPNDTSSTHLPPSEQPRFLFGLGHEKTFSPIDSLRQTVHLQGVAGRATLEFLEVEVPILNERLDHHCRVSET